MSLPTSLASRLWLAPMAFGRKTLLHDGDIPWHDATSFASWLSQTQVLVGRGVGVVDLSDGVRAWLLAHPDVVNDLRAAKGPLGAVRGLCAHPGFTAWLQSLVRAVSTTLPVARTVWVLPAPGSLMTLLTDVLHGSPALDVDPDDAEDASVYLANALRALPADALAAVVFDVRGPGGDQPAGLATLQKVCAHYRWAFGVRATDADKLGALKADCLVLDKLRHEASPGQPHTGLCVSIEQAAAALNTHGESDIGFVLIDLPDHLPPEQVLSDLRALISQD